MVFDLLYLFFLYEAGGEFTLRSFDFGLCGFVRAGAFRHGRPDAPVDRGFSRAVSCDRFFRYVLTTRVAFGVTVRPLV